MTQSGKRKPIIVIAVLIIAAAAAAWWHLGGGSSGAAARQHRSALELLPEGTTVVVTVDAEFLTGRAFDELAKGIGVRLDDAETRQEVGDLFKKRLGLDPLKVNALTVFVFEDDVGMLVRGELGFDPSVGQSSDYEGHTITILEDGAKVTSIGDVLVVGERSVLQGLIDVERGARKALAGTPAGDLHEEILGEVGGGILVGTIVFDAKMNEGFAAVAEGASVQAMGLRMQADGTGTAVLKADAATRTMLLKKLEDLKHQAREGIVAAREHMDDMEVLEGAGVILADRHMDKLFGRLTPREAGDLLRLDLDGGSGGLMAMSAGLSAMAVPAFIKYMRRAKTAEAVDLLDKIYKGAADYYATPRVSMEGDLPCQFPVDSPLTPTALGCCDPSVDADGDCRCDANPAAWDMPGWAALKFEILDAHSFSYSFDSEGQGGGAMFTAHAQADLDGDGNFSTFQRFGKGGLDNDWGQCGLSGGAALFTYNETE
ncbi:MAG: hypothetical protein ABIK09_19030 [Pseudomonadota bacterium]